MQRFERHLGQSNGAPRIVRLWLRQHVTALRPLGFLESQAHLERPYAEIYVLPMECKELTFTHTRCQGQYVERVEAVTHSGCVRSRR